MLTLRHVQIELSFFVFIYISEKSCNRSNSVQCHVRFLFIYIVMLFFCFFFLQQYDILFKMLVTFLLQKPKLLMKYFILTFSYIMNIISNNIYQKDFFVVFFNNNNILFKRLLQPAS